MDTYAIKKANAGALITIPIFWRAPQPHFHGLEEVDFSMSDVGVVVGRCADRGMQEGYIGVYRRLHYRDYGPLLASNPH